MNINLGFLPLLALLFIGLKLGGVIFWSWWWVLAPIWIPGCIAVFILGCMVIVAMIVAALK